MRWNMVLKSLSGASAVLIVASFLGGVAFAAPAKKEAAPEKKNLSSEKSNPAKGVLDVLTKNGGLSPERIIQYTYRGKVVYLAEMPCCDHYNVLFSGKYSEICAPSGGFAGNGDGKCDDFDAKKSDEKVLWTRKK
jgi:hypothetical protein